MAQQDPGRIQVDTALMVEWAKKAGEKALSYRGKLKRDFINGSIVTSADQIVETYLIEQIRARHPEHAILSEGAGYLPGDERSLWILDPIDGTRAFASGLPIWGVSLGFFAGGQPTAGVYFMPAVQELYTGWGGKAYFNNKQIFRVKSGLAEDPSTFLAVPSGAFRSYDIAYPRVRSLGSVAAHLAYAARGIAIGVLTRQLYIWDIAGVYPLLQATGIELQYLDGVPLLISELMGGTPARGPLLAARPEVRKGLLASIKLKEQNNP